MSSPRPTLRHTNALALGVPYLASPTHRENTWSAKRNKRIGAAQRQWDSQNAVTLK